MDQCCPVVCCNSAPHRHLPISSVKGFMYTLVSKPFISKVVYMDSTIVATKDKPRLIRENDLRPLLSCPRISAAVAMTHLGAKEATAEGIASALCWQKNEDSRTHEQFKAYLTLLKTPNANFSLSTANRIYMQQNFKILDDFKKNTQTLYLAEPVNADFAGNAEAERSKINTWVAEETRDKIKDLIAEGVLDSLTRMVIVNAIYFKGNWDVQFDANLTQPLPFKLAPGQTKPVPMMMAKEKYAVCESKDLKCRAIEIPYKNKDLSMVVILPSTDFGLQDLIKELCQEKLERLLNQLGHPMGEVELTLPKFEVTSSHSLREPLSALGMSDAFSMEKADFSSITGSQDLYISAAIHKAFIKVNEEGTEAAAATAVAFALRCAPIRNMPFIADHPFLYLIKDNRSQRLILFMGAIVNPTS
ncbi:serpin b6 [Plakobranchus ocellatus]|uniref:Serpin b6 n=1 Tax=Plakobranchus ocellatus TaxID=259542 RepID=A0AAV4BZG9_9GAST|nr:serpin b6 [Plakobranchus ocellatus]